MTDYEELENGANPEPEDLEAFREAGKALADTLQPTMKTTMDKVGESVAKIMEPTFNEAQEPLRNAFIDLMAANEQSIREFGKVDSKERQIIEALTPEMVNNPYTDEAYALFSNNNDPISHYDNLALTYYFTSPAFKNTEGQEIVGGGLGRLESIVETISNDYLDLVEDKRNGKFEDISLPDSTGLLPDEVNDLHYKFLHDLHRSGLWPAYHAEELPEVFKQDTNDIRQTHVYLSKTIIELANIKASGHGKTLDMANKAEKKSGKEIKTRIAVKCDLVDTKGKPISDEDLILMRGAADHWIFGNEYITTAQIVAASEGTPRPSQKMIDQAHEDLRRLTQTKVYINYLAELRTPIDELDPETVKSFSQWVPAFNAVETEIETVSGVVVKGWQLPTNIKPIIVSYSEATGRHSSFSQRLLNATAPLTHGSNDRRRIREIIFRKVAHFRNDPKKQNHMQVKRIKLETLFKDAKIKNLTRTKKNRLTDYVLDLLGVFVEFGQIGGYEIIRANDRTHTITAIDLKPIPKAKLPQRKKGPSI